jgi:hypothetical protein
MTSSLFIYPKALLPSFIMGSIVILAKTWRKYIHRQHEASKV